MRRALAVASAAGAVARPDAPSPAGPVPAPGVPSADVPVGAVVYDRSGVELATGTNEREATGDPTAHAEVVALRRAAESVGRWRLTGCTLVVTLEPCTMCAGAIVLARVDTVVFGAWDPKAGAVGSLWDVVRDVRLNHRPEVFPGILADECGVLLRDFFHGRRRTAAGSSGARRTSGGPPPADRLADCPADRIGVHPAAPRHAGLRQHGAMTVHGTAQSRDVRPVAPLTSRPDAVVRVPGSKSVTNRALLCAALADGVSTLTGCLFADDTEAMMGALRELGAGVDTDAATGRVVVTGAGAAIGASPASVDGRMSGTTSRFVLPVAALTGAPVVVDVSPQLRARPFGPLLTAMTELGATVRDLGEPGHLPVEVSGPFRAAEVDIPGHLSSQFLSGLMLAAPRSARGLTVRVTTPLVSVPYVRMTGAVMSAFGVDAQIGPDRVVVPHAGYRAVDYRIEPDASAASYFYAAAAITGGKVTVADLGRDALQGDVGFVDLLARMGATVRHGRDGITVEGTGRLQGIDVDMADISDTAQTLAAVAVFADSPTRVRGIGFIRRKETDRIGAVVTELRRAGIDATEDPDGFTIHPGAPGPTVFDTYGDHRMAMSLSLLGLRAPGIAIADPGCVAKTFPSFFTVLDTLR